MATQSTLPASLPAPKYSPEDETPTTRDPNQQRGPRIVGPDQIQGLVVVRSSRTPRYGQRAGWRPTTQEDFGDGGAFPEIHVAQYPLDMGRRPDGGRGNAVVPTLDSSGRVQYDAIAKLGHGAGRIVQASFSDLIPLRQRADMGEIDLSRPSSDQVRETTERTKQALASLITSAVAAQKPKNIKLTDKEATFVRYTPADQMGNKEKKQERIFKVVKRQLDPMELGKWKHKKIPAGPRSPPPPVLHSPPRKLTREDVEAWRIPSAVSNWKNAKGYTVPLDKRVAANGQALQSIEISDKHAQLAEAIKVAEKTAREEVQKRAEMQQKLAEHEKRQKEEKLRALAQKAREERTRGSGGGGGRGGGRERARSRDSRRSRSPGSDSDAASARSESDSDDSAVQEREEARRERRREEERKLRQSRMGAERRIQVMAREQDRDISEKIALGLAKPTQSKESMYDSRLFNRTGGFEAGFNEDNHYDKPLFEARNAIAEIYRPRGGAAGGGDDYDDDDAGDKEMAKLQKAGRFGDALVGKGAFKGTAEAEAREGPVQFEKEAAAADPFDVDKFLSEVEKSGPKRAFGLQEGGGEGTGTRTGKGTGSEPRQSKRAKVEEEEDEEGE